ncbi:probable disease resistance protein At1g58602 [Salvia splendens]|uniref:probable disease resistance protein At1g58602 n=1 Tax=Salvia splendens TaxID=180675 RepID=UPI001C2645B8|nr:probable disease resistance protein At1g58602 [Salvia splendens]
MRGEGEEKSGELNWGATNMGINYMVSPWHILHNRAKFRELFNESGVLKSFLDKSCMSALETKMRDAELLFDSHTRLWLNQSDILFFVEEMSAHALLVSLHRTLNSAGLRNTAPLKSLREMVTILLNFLGNASNYMPILESNIREAAHKAEEALIEFQFPHKFRVSHSIVYYRHALLFVLLRFLRYMLFCACYVPDTIPFGFGIVTELCIAFASCISTAIVVLRVLGAEYNSKAPENEELHRAINDFSMVVRDVIKIEEAGGNQTDFPAYVSAAASFRQEIGGSGQDVVVVGLDSNLKEIKDRLFQDSPELKLATIVGIGGIGKSTLAEQVYKDPDILDRFDIRAWVRVSQEYSVRHVLLGILNTTERLTHERREDSEEELALYLHKILMYRRYIIIMDDVLDTHIWEFLNRYLPDNNNGSRLLLTSRLQNVASQLDSSSKPYQMRCLSDDKSWELLCRKVFGAQGCRVELESVGREISQNC